MQASQGGGLSGTATSSVLGGQNAGNVLSRITTWLALFLTLAVIISVLSGPSDTESTSLVKQAAENRPDIPAAELFPLVGTLDADGITKYISRSGGRHACLRACGITPVVQVDLLQLDFSRREKLILLGLF